jgi:glycosyltransferase involved in cell wall biosynthesis
LLARDPELRVLFVEPALDVLHRLRGRQRRGPAPGLRPIGATGRVWAFRPVKLLPRRLGPFADRALERQISVRARRLGLTRPVLWINDASYAHLPAKTGWPTVYDVTDDWLLEDVGDRQRRRREADDGRLLADADVVVVCSAALAASRGAIRDVVLVPNAVDVERFCALHARPRDLPGGPTAVYVGTLHEARIDVRLVERLGVEMPDLQVVLVGPNAMGSAATARLSAVPNVRLLGARPHEAVPAYLQHADVVIVPHLETPFTETLDPIKAYECVAAGRTTVATPVAGFRDLGEPVRCCPSEAFVAEVRLALGVASRHQPLRDPPTWARRVVYLDHTARLSGAELAMLRLMPALAGVDAHVILAEDGPLVDRLSRAGVTVEVLPMAEAARSLPRHRVRPSAAPLVTLWQTLHYVAALRARLRELRPNLVHTNSLKAAVYGCAAARLAGVPTVCHIRDRIADDYLPPAAARLVRAVLRSLPDAVIANSAATLATLGPLSRGGRVVLSPVIYDCVAGGDASPRPTPGAALRIGMVGRIAPWKGQHLFLEAFARAFPTGADQAVVIGAALFGEDAYEAELHALVARLGIGGRVEFTGFVDDVVAALGRLDALVHASVIPEPFGLVVAEGMAAGLPVVAAAAGGPLEVVTDGIDGLLFAPGDVDALASALRELKDGELRSRLGSAAKARSEVFAPERIAAQVSTFYDRLLDERAIRA